jgi:uncharacterized protein YndB with AHSA1/START domain
MDLRGPRDLIWEAWIEPERLVGWLCSAARVSPAVGEDYELRWRPGALDKRGDRVARGAILSIDRPRLLALSWLHEDATWPEGGVTEVTLRLFPTLDGTRLELVHEGWGAGTVWARHREAADRLWSSSLERMRTRLVRW